MVRRSRNAGQTISQQIDRYGDGQREQRQTMSELAQSFEYEPDDQIIPDYLDPIGDTGFFITPNEPADPWDCARYPNSPYCGGTGVDVDSILDISPVSLEPWVSANDCEICVNIESSLFWIALPTNQVCYRSKDASCYQDPPEPDPPPPPEPQPPPPGGRIVTFQRIDPGGYPPGSGCFGNHSILIDPGTLNIFGEPDVIFPRGTYGNPIGIYWKTEFDYSDPSFKIQRVSYSVVSRDQGYGEIRVQEWQTFTNLCKDRDCRDRAGFPVYQGWRPNSRRCDPMPRTTPSPPPYLYPPPQNCKPCMASCCNPKENQEILEILKLIAKRLGTADYPVSTPQWLVSNQGNSSVKHQSLTQFNFWLMRQLDALIGEFPIKIEVQDSDPTEKGEQSKSISLPNLAEAVAEIYGLAAKTSIDSDVHTSFLIRLAAETMAAKTAALIAQDYASANASYLGYQGNQIVRKVDFAFDPTALDSLETILKASRNDVIGWQNDDKENVAAYLQKLMFSAGLLKTVFFRKGNDLERVLKEVAQFMPDPEAEESEGWKEFVRMINDPESVENKGTDIKPEIKNVSQKQTGGGS